MFHLGAPALMVSTVAALVLQIPALAVAAGMTAVGLPNCNTTCGNVSVPYPFGLGPERCYHSPGFKLTCDRSSNSPRLLLGEGGGTWEVVGMFLENSTMRVVSRGLQAINMSGGSGDGSGRWSWSLGDSVGSVPYTLLDAFNEFILTGCNVEATLLGNSTIVTGCASFCSITGERQILGFFDPYGGKTCTNIGCCQSTIIVGHVSYMVDLKRLDGNQTEKGINLSSNVLIAERGWFDEDMASNMTDPFLTPGWKAGLVVPVILQWAVAHGGAPTDDYTRACPADAAQIICKSNNSECRDEGRDAYKGYSCQCNKGYHGNPYLTHGCQDIKECDRKQEHGCYGDCQELPGTFRCRCPHGFHGNYTMPGGCSKSVNTGLIIGLSVASGPCIILLVLGAALITRDLKQRNANKLRQQFFSQNRGQLLKQLVAHRSDIAERMLIPLEQLQKATNNFDEARRLGGGGHGTVYKGILSDLHVVAIKKSNIVVKREIDEFINEVAILSQINHRNIVKLHGCCLETEVPLLAYEFISNGTLSDHLHTEELRSLSWEHRLRIASEIGKAHAYLHSAVTVPIIHRDIKPSNILLDDALTAKVSDFGASRYIPVDQTGVTTTTAVQGTIGYLDPMYYYTGHLTESSDVYSFGVLLVELLTRRNPSSYRSSVGDVLVMQFVALLAQGNLIQILDPQVIEEGGCEVEDVASLAVSCMKLRDEERPTMRQVDMVLEALQAPKEHFMADSTAEKYDKKNVVVGCISTSGRTNRKEASIRHSLEEEYLLAARNPR